MKKSTLITTIAMIVVVVVALSTATYAWFSAATTTSVSDSITTVAASEWVIMGASRSGSNTGTDAVVYSSTQGISLTMMNGLYSPVAKITATPTTATNSANFALTKFFTAKQIGNGAQETAMAESEPSYDPISGDPSSAANYVRVINTKSGAQSLVLTITVATDGSTDSDFYAANGFCTYVAWKTASGDGSANTAYYHGTVASTSTGEGVGYYEATRTALVEADGVVYQTAVDAHNAGAIAGLAADPKAGYVEASEHPITIGEVTIDSGYYYQIKITIDSSLASNAAANVAFYAWFDGWVIDNTGANSGATVYYEFGKQ